MDIADQKRILRRTTLARRGTVTPETRAAAAETIARAVMDLPEMRAAESVMGFASFGTEIPTDPLIAALLASGRRVLMPVVTGSGMAAAAIGAPADLAPGYRGIREPVAREALEADADVILVPGVAFDPAGRRLGYGGGFYDAFLAAARGTRAGLCFECQIVEQVPVESGDLPVEIVVTEARVLRPA